MSLLTDSGAEGDEHFLFTLSNPTTNGTFPVRLGHQSAASMTIDDLNTPITLHYGTKWVSNAGSDVTGDGSEAHPWHSLQFAADNVHAGDYVIVQPGNYWGFQITTSGKPDARITFHAEPGVNIDAPNSANNLDGINVEGASFVTIEGFHVANMPRTGIRSVLNDGVVLRENVSENNGYWGFLTGWSENIIIENNIASGSVHEHGIYVSNSADGAIVRNNIVFGNRCGGIQFNADGYLPGDGVHSHNLVEGNVIYENGVGGGGALNLDGFQDSIIRNNLLYNNHATGIVLYVGYAADSSTNNLVQNNTVIMAADSRWALLMINGSSGNTVVNNILLTKNPTRGSVNIEADSLPAYSDYNIVQDLFQLDGYNHSFADYQMFTGGTDAHSIVLPQGSVMAALDAMFVNPSANDYHLKPGSIAIDAGDASHAPGVDIFHHPRPSGAGVDIGAYEAGVSLPSVQFEWDNTVAYEEIGMGEIAIIRTGDTEGTLSVNVTSANGTAGNGDYTPINEFVTFKPGEYRKTIRAFVNNDPTIEQTETVFLTLNTLADPADLGGPASDQATLNILSDDAWIPGTFEFQDKRVTINEAAGTATVTVVRKGGSNGEVSVNYTTAQFTPPQKPTWEKRHTDLLYPTDNDTSATTGSDYTSVMGTLTFADGETSKTITIPITNDAWYEGDEAFVLKLSDPTNGGNVGQQSEVRVRIESDDVKQAGTFVFGSTTYNVIEGTPYLDVVINRVNGGNVEASVRLYDTGAGDGVTTASAWAGSEYDFLPGQLTFAAGEMSKTVRITLTDDNVTEMNKVFSIQLYSPTNDATVGNPGTTNVTIIDNESTFYFKAPNGGWSYSVNESAGFLPVEVVRQGSLATPASVKISTQDWGSAVAGVDYTAVNVTLNFAPGEYSKTVMIPIINDTMMEPNESFGVTMSNAVGAEQGNWTWNAAIVDNDVWATPGTLQLSASSYSVNENGGNLTVTVKRTGGSQGTVAVRYETSDGYTGVASSATAWAGSNYTSTKGTLTFLPGETVKTFTIPILDNTSVSVNKVFTIALKSVEGGATLGAAKSAKATIVENDSAIELAATSYTVSEGAGFVNVTLARKGSTVGEVSADLAVYGSSASNGVDFNSPSIQKVTFANGVSSVTIQIAILD
ncbi:MAG: right-handed parallel beta-helix repeat-containing protein, partial [Planctomycetota bacterium]|nr:right-handed parallel beta-helix repeat-containing protein [Planctomycetota bacterium]